jgi:hypothetical protein
VRLGETKIVVGQRYGQLTVLSFNKRFKGHLYWNCLCDCGNNKLCTSDNLLNGTTHSCGCARKGPRPHLRKISRELVTSLYVEGLSTRKVARRLGYSETWIAKLVKELGISRNRLEGVRLASSFSDTTHWRSCRAQARKVMERHLGRKLKTDEHVHHINHDYTDRRIENLVVMNASDHAKHHHPKNPIPRWLRPERKAYMKKYFSTYRKGNATSAS